MLISTNSGMYSAVRGRPRIPMVEAMDFFGQAGFEAVDVNFSAVIYEGDRHESILDGDFRANLDEVQAAAKRNGLVLALTHLPFYRYDMEDTATLAHNDAMMLRAIEATAYIGVKHAVIHPYRDESATTGLDGSITYLTPFREKAAACGVSLCVENMRDTSAELLVEIADALESGICWDVGHANLAGLEQRQSIRTLGKRLKVLHLHDNYGTKDDHSLPFLGTVDWRGIMDGLSDVGYEGVFNYEVNATELPLEMRRVHAEYLVEAAKLLLGRNR
ncbi:sugar phosphate isomerase/epimerase [Eubacteriales bacterium OttesenSCG-928-A19]|nr:sugar phosphate isomerase/epimerase [Eubacteriales bacterium OttesenSCG-928-A19]